MVSQFICNSASGSDYNYLARMKKKQTYCLREACFWMFVALFKPTLKLEIRIRFNI